MIRKRTHGALASALLVALAFAGPALPVRSTPVPAAGAVLQTCLGDVDGDGFVGVRDVLLVTLRIGSRAGDARYNPAYDLNGDRRINTADIYIVLRQLGSCSAATATQPAASPTPTASATRTPIGTPTSTRTATSTVSPTRTATSSPTASATAFATDTATATPSNTATNTPTATPTNTATSTATNTAVPTATPTNTPTDTSTVTATHTATPTTTSTPEHTATATAIPPTDTPTATPSATEQPTATATSTPGTGLPPDPAVIAPANDLTVATDILSSTAFLYTGSDPIQTGVSPGTIELQRVAVLRGRVLDRSDQPLAGVRIGILNHAEFGETLSRADGMFDMAVNGGGQLVIEYAKDGYLPSQRAVNAPWRDFAWAADVVLVELDTVVTTIDLTSPSMQAAQGSAETDSDGTRQATVLFPAGTTATMRMPDGSTQPLPTLNFRATEFTVGDNGPEAMPAELPPSSGYTYAVELSADEAIGSGATRIDFNQALPVYLENFLDFAVGGAVPAGYYDREKGQWVPSDNGRVVEVVSITGGAADLDLDGDGVADGAAALAALGITDDERANVGQLYAAGQTLWRVPVTHFTPWDYNWPWGPDPDAIRPDKQPPEPRVNPCIEFGSVIGCEAQTLGESVPVVGTSWGLHYQSERAPGNPGAYTLEVPLIGSVVPGGLRRIRLEVSVGGKQYDQAFAPAPDLVGTMTWDGRDAYGRPMQGTQRALVTLRYDYEPVYYTNPDDLSRVFARAAPAGVVVTGRGDSLITLSNWWEDSLGAWDGRAAGLGGWSLSAHHAFNRGAETLLMGDGRQRNAGALGGILTTVAGNGTPGSSQLGGGDGGRAALTAINFPEGTALGPDGSIFIAETGNHRIRRISPNGIITTIAGNSACGFSGNGGQATAAQICQPRGISVGADGSVFFVDNDNRVRRVAPNGTITSFAGSGAYGSSGDDGPAVAARFEAIWGTAVGADGSLFIADTGNGRVRQVGPDGIVHTVAGTTTRGYSGDGGPATEAQLLSPFGIAVGPDGSVYFTDVTKATVRRVAPDGLIDTVAGSPTLASGFSGDGGPATLARFDQPLGVAVGLGGDIFIADAANRRIRRVGSDGIITTFAGRGAGAFGDGEQGPASAAALYYPHGVSIEPDGDLIIAETAGNRILRVSSAMPGFALTDTVVGSLDGSELYVFNGIGRHLRTLEALTGATILTFAYDASGYLTSITDRGGNVTTIERSGANATAIVAPGGQRTTLGVNGDGWLTSVANPLGETHAMTYQSPEGLLATFSDPLNQTSTFEYDPMGRLTLDDGPDGATTTLSRTELPNGYEVTTTSTLGSVRTYRVESLPTGTVWRTLIAPGGATTVAMINPDASGSVAYADGMQTTFRLGPDPRFGMLAALVTNRVRTAPGGQTETMTGQRVVTLANPANLMSLQTLTDTMTVNGRTFTATYNAATRTMTTTSAEGRQTSSTLDTLGRQVSETIAPGITPIAYTYDAQGRLGQISQGALSTTYGYDSRNRVVTETDAAGLVTGYGHDAADRVTSMTLPGGGEYEFAYDANGNRTGVIMPSGATHGLGYTSGDAESSYTPPGSGSYTTTLDADGRLTNTTLPGGRSTLQNYDALGRVAGMSTTEGSTTFAYAGGDLTDRVSLIGNAPAVGAAQDLALTYNGSLITGMAATGASPSQATYAYNNDLFPTSLNLASGADSVSNTLSWDRDGLATQFGPFTYVRNGPGGAPMAITDTALSTSYGYDALARPSTRTQQVASQARYAMQLTYDASGRVSGKTETVNGVAHTYVYTYDLDGQLKEVKRDGVVTESYAYDANGNRTSSQLGAGAVQTATYDTQDRLTGRGGITYQFNTDGFLAQRGSNTFVYDTRGQLTGATIGGQTITYAYDGLGRRVSRTDSSGTYRYIYGDPASDVITAMRDPAGVFTMYYYDTDGLLIALDRGGVRYYVATDQVGTPRIVSDVAGAVLKTVDSDTFGNVIADSNPAFDLPIGYAGGLSDSATGLVHFGLRDYEPVSGRWTARDPIRFAGGQGNLYSYVSSSPVQHRDPSGLFCVNVTFYQGVGGGVGGCITKEGTSFCAEIGFGVGASVDADDGGLEETGSKILVEGAIEATGWLEFGGELALDSNGCLTFTKKGQIGPVKLEEGKIGLDKDVDGPKLGSKAEAKIAGKQCIQRKW